MQMRINLRLLEINTDINEGDNMEYIIPHANN